MYLQKDLEDSFRKLECILHRTQEDIVSVNEELE